MLIAGYGDLGSRVAKLAVAQGMEAIGLCRSVRPAEDHIQLITCDVTQPATLAPLAGLSPDMVLYCVAADAQTDASYRAQYVDGLSNVLQALRDAELKHIFFVSSTRVYGQNTAEKLDEKVIAVPADFGGERLMQGEKIALSHGTPATVLRLSGIYGPGRLRMLRLAQQPVESWPPNSWTNRIHIEDAAGFIMHLISERLAGVALHPCYIVTDNEPAPMHEVLNWVAQKLALPQSARVEPANGGKRLDNHQLRESGYRLRYPSYREGYAELLSAAGND